ncbi:MAG TPA: MdtA/MuxA family multidrug efflux RND transporter periplasmic adaptor subunit [Opitutus sp.]|nr:MdtA/MuxA family multidrug efflux RND transporter periplasmic adaptor subunit [Opitutus sp.]
MSNLSPESGSSSRETRPAALPVRPRRRRTAIVIGLVGAVLLGFTWWINHRSTDEGFRGRGRGGRHGGWGDMGPLPVGAHAAAKGALALYLDGLGTVTPLHTVTVRTQIAGHLVQIAFQEGQLVHQGDLLAVIDPRPYEVALEQAQGQLEQAQSQLKTAQLDLARYETLAQQDSIASQQVDTARSQVAQYQGAVQADQAEIDSAKLNLTYCHIKSPIDGRVGLRLVDQGNYVTPGDANGLVVITQTKPITVIFTLPEDNIARVAARLRSGAKLAVEVFDRTHTRKLADGVLTTIDNQIDTATGTFRLRAEFPNEDETLFPNQFVNVRLLVDTVSDATVVPTSAIERNEQGTFVYVVQPDNTVAARPVTLGAMEAERVAVTSGLKLGELVVTDGADRLKEGMQVTIQEGATPTSEAPPNRWSHAAGDAAPADSSSGSAKPAPKK